MDVLVTGSSGLVGSALVHVLRARGDRVVRLVRDGAREVDTVVWRPDEGLLEGAGLEGFDAVVHLAGAGIAEARWTEDRKRLIRESRIQGTDLLARTLAGLSSPPSVLVSASAVGYYGNRGDEVLTESSAPGDDFLAEVCRRWEAATAPAAEAGIRVARVRTGIVLARHGGALARMLTPFRLGLGGRLGDGRQYMSWITLADEVRALVHLLDHDIAGPVNLTAPTPVTNAELTAALGRVLRRPTLLPTPLLALRLRYGTELVDQLLVASQRVIPERLGGELTFAHPEIEPALASIVGR